VACNGILPLATGADIVTLDAGLNLHYHHIACKPWLGICRQSAVL
jgi:hypothetical protein